MTPLRAFALFLLPLLSACSTYTLEGRVVRGSFSGMMLVEPDDPRLAERGLAGVTVAVIRDAQKLNREQVGSSTSDGDGDLAIAISSIGAGITDESWLFSVGRSGYGRVESTLRLPSSAKSKRLLVILTKGPAGLPDDPNAQLEGLRPSARDEILRDVERYSK